MIIDRRSGAPSTFTWILGLTLGVACAAMTTACSASSGNTAQDGWGQSGGGPLGGGSGGGAAGGNDASTSAASSSGGHSDAASPLGSAEGGGASADAGGPGDAASPVPGDGASAGDAPGDGAATTADFTLLDTAITGIIDGSPVAGFDPIAEGATINLAVVGPALSIRANTVPAVVGSVAFALDATYTHTESTAPYTLCSDDGKGTITSCASILKVGKHTLTATPYSAAGLLGDAGAPVVLDFTIVDVADAGIADAGGQ